MSPTKSAAAVCAAVSGAAGFGITCPEPVVLADGANVVVHLSPTPVVAKVAASTTAVRPDAGTWLQRELDVALFLTRQRAPVMPPSPEIPATIHRANGHVMSFWHYLRPSGAALPDEATIGSMPRDLHAVLRPYPGAVPVLAPLRDIPAFLARPQSQISVSDAAALAAAFTRLTAELDPASYTAQGAAWRCGRRQPHATATGWTGHDFEDVCSGPVAWDLAPSAASLHLDGSRVLAAYGDAVDAHQLAVCRQLRLLHLTIWHNLYAERLPECRLRAAELLASWQAP